VAGSEAGDANQAPNRALRTTSRPLEFAPVGIERIVSLLVGPVVHRQCASLRPLSSRSGSLVASSMVQGGREAAGCDFSSVTRQAGSGCVFEPYIMQECADPGIDPLLLLIADYASFAEAISFYGHQSSRRRVCDRKDCFHFQWALHG
jgi:hypothetical protein